MRLALLLTVIALLAPAFAEQLQRFGDIEAHYVVISTTSLKPEIAQQYDIVRARDRALVNVALRNTDGEAISARIAGNATNLLGQVSELVFREVREDEAIYYLATLRHTDEESFRFEIEIRLAGGAPHLGGGPHRLRFSQKLYVE